MKREGSRVVIIDNKKILLIHRIKEGREYYVLPGGGIEEGETPKDTAIREAKEETSFDVVVDFFWQFEDEDVIEYYYLVTKFKGKLKLGGPEIKRHNENNQYILEWISLSELLEINFYRKEIRDKILEKYN